MFPPRPLTFAAVWTLMLVSASIGLPVQADFNQQFPGRGSRAAWNASGDVTRQAFAAENRGDKKATEALYRQAIQIYPYDAQAYFNLGLFLNHQKRYKEAEPYLRKSIELQPIFQNWHQLAIALGHQNNLNEARQSLSQAERYIETDRQRSGFDETREWLLKLQGTKHGG